ncbi:hypothetical protein NN6n1_42670 [Shinella zoogloeoides]
MPASVVLMPEAAVDKDGHLSTGKHDVGACCAYELMQPKAVTFAKETLAHEHFRLRVFAFDLSHHG